MDFSERLNKVVDYSGLTRKEFAEIIGKKEASIYNYLKGKSKLDTDQLIAIKNQINELNLDWLIFGTGNMLNESTISALNESEVSYGLTYDCEQRVKELLYTIETQKQFIELLKEQKK